MNPVWAHKWTEQQWNLNLNNTWHHTGCSQGCALNQCWYLRWLYILPHNCASAKPFLTAGLHLWALSYVKACRWLFYCSELREHAQLSTPGCAGLPVMSPATTEKHDLSQTPKVQVSLLCLSLPFTAPCFQHRAGAWINCWQRENHSLSATRKACDHSLCTADTRPRWNRVSKLDVYGIALILSVCLFVV